MASFAKFIINARMSTSVCNMQTKVLLQMFTINLVKVA